jgi:hypothetical protein
MFLCLEIDKFSCDFEDSICQWTQDKSDDFGWTRNQAFTSSKGTGPLTDHTKDLGNGYILLAEVPSPSLSSPSLSLPSALPLSPVHQHHHRYHHHHYYHHKVLYLLTFYVKIFVLIHFIT